METRILKVLLSLIICFGNINIANSQNDQPNPIPNIKWVPHGSLVIGTDNVTQADARGRYNLKVYGLVNALLQASIPVQWSIKSGKVKDGTDFNALAQQVSPTTLTSQTYEFKSGPFVIDSTHHDTAMVVINSYGNNVKVYRLVSGVEADIRYTIGFKPDIAVLSNGGNQNIHLDYLDQAGIITITGNDSVTGNRLFNEPWVDVIPASQIINWGGCYTFASEAHWDTSNDTIHTYAIYRFLQNGSNFLAQCEGVQTYENDDTLATNSGIDVANASFTYSFYNADMPFLQIEGPLDNIGGSLKNWVIGNNGDYKSTSYLQIGSADEVYQVARATKTITNGLVGGNAFYLGGHDYGAGWQTDRINGRRMYLNAIFVPAAPQGNCAQIVFPLPVTMLNFEGAYSNEVVKLKWATGSEINNDFFMVERSHDGETFKSIGKVKGAGNTNSTRYYDFMDLEPIKGISYYRLIQTDYDGSQHSSKVIAVLVRESKFFAEVIPNPASESDIVLQLSGDDLDITGISIINSLGKVVMEVPSDSKSLFDQLILNINIESLSSGYYTIRIQVSDDVFYTRFIKS